MQAGRERGRCWQHTGVENECEETSSHGTANEVLERSCGLVSWPHALEMQPGSIPVDLAQRNTNTVWIHVLLLVIFIFLIFVVIIMKAHVT